MKKKGYVIPFLFVLSCLFFSEMKAQDEQYSKVSVIIDDPSIVCRLVDLGMTIDHYEYLTENSIGFYVNQEELQILEKEQIDFSIEIADYRKYYQQQKEDDAEALASMVRSANVGDGFDLGSMGGRGLFLTVLEENGTCNKLDIYIYIYIYTYTCFTREEIATL